MSNRTGQCMCGAVKLVATDVPEVFSACYCKMCQRWMGSSFRGVSVKFNNLTISGQESISVFQSSGFAERANCRICGSALWYHLTAGKYAGNTSIPVGLLDDTSGLTLSHEYFSDYKNNADIVPEGCLQSTEADVEKMIADFIDGDVQ